MKFDGPLTGLVTPFDRNEAVNTGVLKEEVEFALCYCKPTGLMVAAAEIQEAVRLSREEKIQCIEAVVDAANGRVPVIAGASDTSTFGAIELARRAKEVGADALMVMPPFGGPPKGILESISIQAVIDFYADLASAVDIPILIYNSTTLSPHLSARVVEKIVENDNIVGMEETSLDYQVIVGDIAALSDKISILVKSYVLLPALEAGVHGAIMPVGFSRIGAEAIDAFQKGDRKLAYDIQKIMCQIPPEKLSHKPAICFYKEALRQIGLDVGLPRRPADHLTDGEKLQISEFLSDCGLDKIRVQNAPLQLFPAKV